MKHRILRTPLRLAVFGAALLTPFALSACGSGGGGGGGGATFVVRNTSQAVAPTTPLQMVGKLALYFADEATTGAGGTNFNAAGGDVDFLDSIATVVDTSNQTQTTLDVAAVGLWAVQDEVWVCVDEAQDSRDWDGDTILDDLVLLHWDQSADAVTLDFVDVVDPNPNGPILPSGDRLLAIATADRLYYTSEADPPPLDKSTLVYLEPAAPTTRNEVLTTGAVALDPHLIGIDEGLIFAALDERIEDQDLNGDADKTDSHVIALVDAGAAVPQLQSTGLAAEDSDVPYRARSTGANDWVVGFLASEDAYDAHTKTGGFNDPGHFPGTWLVGNCVGSPDLDWDDDVLHFLRYADWFADPVLNPPANTGLVGTDRVVATAGTDAYVGTISAEVDEGGCDLNADDDFPAVNDYVARWVKAEDPPGFYFTESDELITLADVNGGTMGLAELGNLLIAVVDESKDALRDFNGDDLVDFELVGWLDPEDEAGATWTFDHGEVGDPCGGFFVATDWLGETPARDRILISMQEDSYWNNCPCAPNCSSLNPFDPDILDGIPAYGRHSAAQDRLLFGGGDAAVKSSNAGIVVAKTTAFYRVDETEDNRDRNGDGDKGDQILMRAPVAGGAGVYLSVLNDQPIPAGIVYDVAGTTGRVAFLAFEADAKQDFNNDGDQNDYVVRYFRM